MLLLTARVVLRGLVHGQVMQGSVGVGGRRRQGCVDAAAAQKGTDAVGARHPRTTDFATAAASSWGQGAGQTGRRMHIKTVKRVVS